MKAVAMNDERIYESLPKRPNTPLTALTGGFRTCSAMNSALASGHVDLIWPRQWVWSHSPESLESPFVVFLSRIGLSGI